MNAPPPKPQPPKQEEQTSLGRYISWIIFLGIIARPLWNIIRGLIPPSISNQQLLMIAGGILALGVVVVIAVRARDSRPAMPRSPSPSYSPPPMPSPYTQPRSTLPSSVRPTGSGVPRPPTFEPIITGNVVLVGLVVGTVIAAAIALILVASA